MVALRSRRLESIFGLPLDRLDAAAIRSLVSARVQEDYDLDFKRDCYGKSESEQRKLAVDVAAMANAAGGVIILGIEEDEHACAIKAAGVPVNDDEINRMQQIVTSQVAPFPIAEIFPVFGEVNTEAVDQVQTDASTGDYIVVAVPRSTLAPHAVKVNESLRYPKRNGRTTRYLAEYEVAAAYRDRSAGEHERQERLASVEREAVQRFNCTNDPWLVVSLVPEISGDSIMNTARLREFESRYREKPAGPIGMGASFYRVRISLRRVIADGGLKDDGTVDHASLELHADGAGAYGLRLNSIVRSSPYPEDDAVGQPYILGEEFLCAGVINGLSLLGAHARDDAAAGGNCMIRASLVSSDGADFPRLGHTRNTFASVREALGIGSEWPAVESVTSLDELCSGGNGLVQAAARLLHETFQLYGLPETMQLSNDGAVRIAYWGHGWKEPIGSWAQRAGVSIE